ncbi:hypothetical protein MDUV_36490 [Mycolicibacterium duvalii]|uniref:Mce associated membrane protein n=2 Tax=Mycolicibacterium duvalii TaxID=39688 RepID=A0A7I7K5M1_9MYCO|nr:hypothetical protein MDUV_36490 [Mycolicibacterium duvalii]
MTDRERDDEKTEAEPTDDAQADESAAEATADGAQDSGTPTGDGDGRGPWRRRVALGAVALLLVGALATSGFLGWQLWQDRQVARAGDEARAAAVEYAEVLTSIDSAKVDENFNQVLAGATGEFKDMYSQSSAELRQLLIDNKASAHGIVTESAVQSASKDEVVVLMFVDQSVSNAAVPDPRIDRSRIKMTMRNVDGRWLASKVELR